MISDISKKNNNNTFFKSHHRCADTSLYKLSLNCKQYLLWRGRAENKAFYYLIQAKYLIGPNYIKPSQKQFGPKSGLDGRPMNNPRRKDLNRSVPVRVFGVPRTW